MKIILNEQALNLLQQIEKTNILPEEDTGGVFFDSEFDNWVAFKILDKVIGFSTFDTHREALNWVIR